MNEPRFLEFQPKWIRLYADGSLIDIYLKAKPNLEHSQ